MIPKLRHAWQETRSSFWFVPTVIVFAAVSLAVALISLEINYDLSVTKEWHLIFGAGTSASRGLLTSVASSMITVAGVVFSITIVALSLTSSQYTSRVLRNFMSDTNNQVVLGVFVGIYAYCLVVLRTIRSGDEEGVFVPSVAVLGALVLAFVGIAFLIFFIHHISMSIQASSIIATVADETIEAIDNLFPQGLGEGVEVDDIPTLMSDSGHHWIAVQAKSTGYIESIDESALLKFAHENKAILRMEQGIGSFVVSGNPIVHVSGMEEVTDEMQSKLEEIYVIARQRTVQQDAGFGIRQIVDVALKALSPGINDTTTAVMCVDYLRAIMCRLAERHISTAHRKVDGQLRVIAQGPTFESLLAESYDQIRQNSEGNVAILTRILNSLETIGTRTTHPSRRQALRQQADLVMAVADRSIPSTHDNAGVKAAMDQFSRVLNDKPETRT